MSQTPAVREMPDQAAPVLAAENALSNEQIRYIANTEIVPKHLRGKPEAIVATILKGRALGFDDIHSLSAINFIDGKATLSAEAMVTLVRRSGHSLQVTQKGSGDTASATVVGTRMDTGDTTTVTWTLEMAKRAGLTGKDNWKRYPETMLAWRAISQVCRFLFADVLMGVSYTEDEAQEAAERGAVTAAVRDLPAVEEAQIRDEPVSTPSDAQLNRIASLEQRTGDGYRTVLRGVFGVELASELSAEAAGQYEAMLAQSLPPEEPAADPHEVPVASDEATPGDSGAGPEKRDATSAAGAPDSGDDDANHSPGSTDTSPESPLFDDEPEPPAPEDEVVEGEVVEADPDLVRVAGLTTIPIGNFRGTALNQIHDSWIEWALDHPDRLPGPFVEALELYVPAEKPDIWQKKRG